MHNWRVLDKIYLYDGTLEGLLTIAYNSIIKKELPKNIFVESNYIENLFDNPGYIETDLKSSKTVFDKLLRISEYTLYSVYTSFLSEVKNKEIEILKFIIYAFKYGYKANFMKSVDCVINVNIMCRKVGGEAHKYTGFVRFEEINNGILYSEIEPDNNVLELIAKHFSKRLKNENFIINDLKRNIAIVYNTKELILTDSNNLDKSKIKSLRREDNFQDLWKVFFKSINIEERRNLRCQMTHMPKRYWKYLTEMRD